MVSHKVKHTLTLWHSNHTFSYSPRKMKPIHWCKNVQATLFKITKPRNNPQVSSRFRKMNLFYTYVIKYFSNKNKTKYRYVKQHKGISQTLYWAKKVRYKSLYDDSVYRKFQNRKKLSMVLEIRFIRKGDTLSWWKYYTSW